jgi:uncharacterized OB-fold protein
MSDYNVWPYGSSVTGGHVPTTTTTVKVIQDTPAPRIAPIGWQCPRCDRVWSPTTIACADCNSKVATR